MDLVRGRPVDVYSNVMENFKFQVEDPNAMEEIMEPDSLKGPFKVAVMA